MSKAIPNGQQAETPTPRSAPAPEPASGGRAPPIGVYVHFPWCSSKCPYCDFVSSPTRQVPHQDFARKLLAELEARACGIKGPTTLRSVYVGGGTPSLWDPLAVGRVLTAVADTLKGQQLETTLECNPTGLTQQRLEQLLARGVNRLSIGVQSLRGERLRWLGRRHGPADAIRAIVPGQRFVRG